MPDEPKHLLRPLALFWARLGSLQVYFVAILALVLALAAFGLWHLIAPREQIAPSPLLSRRNLGEGGSPAPSTPAPPSSPTPSTPAPPSSPAASTPVPPTSLPRAIAISDVKETMRRGMRGETLVVAEIGMTPQTTADKEKVEIDVSFFDLDRDNQMHPTDAQITYEWLTPERDWTDPAPKYLAATYLKPPSLLSRRSVFAKADPHRGPEQLRYGGFIVRIYSDGKLQDERSKPESLITSLRANAPPTSRRSLDEGEPSPTPRPTLSAEASREGGLPPPPAAETAPPTTDHRSPATDHSSPALSPTDHRAPTTDHSPDSLPKGIVVPGKPGFVQSPYDPKFIIDVRGFPPGTLVNDPNTNKPFRVP